jgi:hypothetical protein
VHTLLHSEKQPEKTDHQKSTTTAHLSNQRKNVLLSTAIVYIQDQRGVNHKCRALLDSCSESNLITESLVNLLGLKRYTTFVPLSGINQMQLNVKHRVKSNILREISQPHKLDAAESVFITFHQHDENCVNTSTPPIQSPLFKLIQ